MKVSFVDDRKLIEKCLLNDRLAQKELFEKYYVAMFNIALRITGNEDLAYDAVQETFINVFNHLQQFKFKSTLGAWIKKILIREAIRLAKIKTSSFVSLEETFEEPVTWPSDISGEYLHQAIMQLPSGYRTIFTLVEIEGYSHKEIAEKLNISEGTSKSQLYYAKRNLQKKLAEFSND